MPSKPLHFNTYACLDTCMKIGKNDYELDDEVNGLPGAVY